MNVELTITDCLRVVAVVVVVGWLGDDEVKVKFFSRQTEFRAGRLALLQMSIHKHKQNAKVE